MRSGRLGAVVLLLTVVLVAGIAGMSLRIVTPGPPPSHVAPRAPLGPPLTKRLALVVLDGLRFDVATEPRRMPKLAARFRSNASAELWAEPISMTASAALVFGSGAHAEIDLAIRNESSQPTLFEDIFTLARRSHHLRTGTVGDPVWTGLYPNGWDVTRADPHWLAVGMSDDEAAFASARAIQTADPPIDLAVFHFPNPDHMAHGHGLASQTYQTYIASFDALLAEFLDRFSQDTTVIVVGDHGATMAGIHGSDTEEQRRTLIVASGPGIVKGAPGSPPAFPRVDDIDIVPTMAALLGIEAPRHARGHPLVSWLDLDDETRAKLACRNVRDLAAALPPGREAVQDADVARACDPQRSATDRIAGALPTARALDERLSDSTTSAQRGGFVLTTFAAVLTALLTLLLFFRDLPPATLALRGLAFAFAVSISVFITANLERLPGSWLTPARIALYAVFNLPLLLWVIRPTMTSRLLGRIPVLGPVLLPGVLVLTETHSALIEAYLLSAVLVGFAITRGIPLATGFPRPWAKAAWRRVFLYVPPLVALSVVCIDAGNFTPEWLLTMPRLQLGVALASVAAFAAMRHARLRPALFGTIACAALAALSLVLRRHVPASVGLAGWGLLAVVASVALYRRKRAYAELLAFASYAWVSRDLEVPFFFASYVVAVGFGEAVGKQVEEAEDRLRPEHPQVLNLSIVSFAFAWGYVQLVGIQMGLHFMHFDFAAGVFRDPGVTMPRIVIALIYKYAVARAILLFGVLLPLPRPMRLLVLRSLVALVALRATVLVASLEAARRSFWTPIWVTSELPHVLLALVVVATATVYALGRNPQSPSREAPANA
jgi:hypothetical protein